MYTCVIDGSGSSPLSAEPTVSEVLHKSSREILPLGENGDGKGDFDSLYDDREAIATSDDDDDDEEDLIDYSNDRSTIISDPSQTPPKEKLIKQTISAVRKVSNEFENKPLRNYPMDLSCLRQRVQPKPSNDIGQRISKLLAVANAITQEITFLQVAFLSFLRLLQWAIPSATRSELDKLDNLSSEKNPQPNNDTYSIVQQVLLLLHDLQSMLVNLISLIDERQGDPNAPVIDLNQTQVPVQDYFREDDCKADSEDQAKSRSSCDVEGDLRTKDVCVRQLPILETVQEDQDVETNAKVIDENDCLALSLDVDDGCEDCEHETTAKGNEEPLSDIQCERVDDFDDASLCLELPSLNHSRMDTNAPDGVQEQVAFTSSPPPDTTQQLLALFAWLSGQTDARCFYSMQNTIYIYIKPDTDFKAAVERKLTEFPQLRGTYELCIDESDTGVPGICKNSANPDKNPVHPGDQIFCYDTGPPGESAAVYVMTGRLLGTIAGVSGRYGPTAAHITGPGANSANLKQREIRDVGQVTLGRHPFVSETVTLQGNLKTTSDIALFQLTAQCSPINSVTIQPFADRPAMRYRIVLHEGSVKEGDRVLVLLGKDEFKEGKIISLGFSYPDNEIPVYNIMLLADDNHKALSCGGHSGTVVVLFPKPDDRVLRAISMVKGLFKGQLSMKDPNNSDGTRTLTEIEATIGIRLPEVLRIIQMNNPNLELPSPIEFWESKTTSSNLDSGFLNTRHAATGPELLSTGDVSLGLDDQSTDNVGSGLQERSTNNAGLGSQRSTKNKRQIYNRLTMG